MDEQLLRKVSHQLRTIKLMLGFFFCMLLSLLGILGFIAYKVITFTHDISTKINSLESKTSQTLDLKTKICDNKSLVGLLGSNNDLCQ